MKHSLEVMPKLQSETNTAQTAAHRKAPCREATYAGKHSLEGGYKRERMNADSLHF
jgi:hypothetical protein